MKIRLVAMIALVILLAGCTVNPQDLAPKTQARNTDGAGGQLTAPNSQNTGQAANQQNPSGSGQTTTPQTRQLTLDAAEVAKHNRANDCWMIINGGVYDLTSYSNHPGGSAYVPYCGTDGTGAFDTKGGRGNPHSSYASSLLPDFQVGMLGQTITLNAPDSGTSAAGGAAAQNGSGTSLPKGGIKSTGGNNTGSRYYREYED